MKCKLISAEQKKFLFEDYYKICDHIKQSTYILGLIQVVPVNRRRHGKYDDPRESRRQCTVYYTIPDGTGKHIQVCRKTFSNIFALSHKRVQVLIEKKKIGETIYKDCRGQANKPRKYFPRLREQVKAYINALPKEENHYSRNKSSKEFLSADLNMNRLFIAFKEKYPDTIATYRYFSDIFKKDFPNLRFGKPKSDTCSTCDVYQNKIRAASDNISKQSFISKLELHHRKAEKARNEMQNDEKESQKPTSDRSVLSIDMEQVLFIPTLTHSQMFYSRQLSCFNLCVHMSDNGNAYMCLWNESLTGRGGNEVASALLAVLNRRDLPVKRKLTIWTDNCIGQNKNRMLLFLFIYLVANGIFQEIEQKFLLSGHSFLPCDRDFAQIEKRKKVSKNYVPTDLESMIKSARHQNPFNIVPLEAHHFKDLNKASTTMLNTSKLNISSVCWIRISNENPGKVLTKTSFSNMQDWTVCDVIRKGRKLEELKNMPLEQLHCQNKISKEKLKNLQDMLDYIPLKHLTFYENLIEKTQRDLAGNMASTSTQ